MKQMSISDGRVCFKTAKYVVYKPYAGLHVIYHAKRFCFSERSRFQKIDIIDNDAYGRMLILDGNVQHTAYDSQIFTEALCATAKTNKVANVLVLGGGSGQTALSLLESPDITQITIVEIDPLVVESCRKYIKGVDHAFKDPRVRIVIGDAFRYLHSMKDKVEATIIDFTERPFGIKNNSVTLKQLYADIRDKSEGRCSQYVGSSVELAYSKRLRSLMDKTSKQFLSRVRYEEVFIPSFGAPHSFMHAGY